MLLAQRRQKSSGVLDFMLLAAVALPSVVFGAGYIFAFSLPLWPEPELATVIATADLVPLSQPGPEFVPPAQPN
jgi:ABC-type Fe3+ transport system permease subunit